MGVVAGISPFDCHWHTTTWTSGIPHDLGTLVGPTGVSDAAFHAINDAGDVTGMSQTPASCEFLRFQPTLWTGGAVMDLGTLASSPCATSYAFGINNSGQVAGTSETDGVSFHAVLYSIETPDTEPPHVSVASGRPVIWPANGAMFPVTTARHSA